MAITLTYHFNNLDELRQHLAQTETVVHGTPDNVVEITEPDPQPETEPEPDPEPEAKPAAKKRSKAASKKPEPEPEPEEPVAEQPEPTEPESAPAPDPETATADGARDALRRLHEAGGMDAAREALQKHGAERLRELEEKDYGPFIKYCNEQVEALA